MLRNKKSVGPSVISHFGHSARSAIHVAKQRVTPTGLDGEPLPAPWPPEVPPLEGGTPGGPVGLCCEAAEGRLRTNRNYAGNKGVEPKTLPIIYKIIKGHDF